MAEHATAAAIALKDKNIAIPIKPKLKEEDYQTVTLSRTVGAEKKKAILPKINQKDPELICKAILEFQDICRAGRLNLNTNSLLNEKFRELLSGTYRTKFDELRAMNPATVPGFEHTVRDFIAHYIKDTALANEQSYLEGYKKPWSISCEDIGERLLEINRLMSLFPGAAGNNPYNQMQLKNCFYKMMIASWQVKYATSINRLTDPNYTFEELVEFMGNQETASKSRIEQCTQGHGGRGRGGRYQSCRHFQGQQDQRPTSYYRYNNGGRGGRFHSYQGSSNNNYGGRGYGNGGRFGSGGRGNNNGGRGYGGRWNNQGRGQGRSFECRGQNYGRGFGGYQQQADSNYYQARSNNQQHHSNRQEGFHYVSKQRLSIKLLAPVTPRKNLIVISSSKPEHFNWAS